jgi:hypothetical protein
MSEDNQFEERLTLAKNYAARWFAAQPTGKSKAAILEDWDKQDNESEDGYVNPLASCMLSIIEETLKWKPMDTCPKDQKNLILKVEGGRALAPCEWQEPGIISEHGFWLHWLTGQMDFVEVLNPLGWFKLSE